jgi:2-polyprenyl-3-methyl-5-hydroxy-6-metoxy-1,4-benzoquinol methylase
LQPVDNTGYEALRVLSAADSFNKWMYSAIVPYASGNILEIGSGLGNISKFFIQNGATITLSDIDSLYIHHLKKEFQSFSNVKDFLSIDLQKENFSTAYNDLNGKFDTVFYLNVLEHLKDDSYAIQNCRYLLKENGTLIILVPAYSFLYSEMDKQLNHYRRYTLATLRKKISAENFTIVKSFYFNFMGIPAWMYGKIRRFKVLPKDEMNLYNKLTPVGKLLDKIVFHRAGLSAIVVANKNDQ